MLTTAAGSSITGALFVGDIYAHAAYDNAPPVSSPLSFSSLNSVATLPGTPGSIARYRLTSWGLKIVGAVAPLNATGFIRVRLFSPLSGSTLATNSISTIFADECYDIPVARLATKDLFIIPAPLGDNARLFRNADDATPVLANWVNPGWQCVQVAVDGAPASTTIAAVHVYYNYELVFVDGAPNHAFAQPPPPNNPLVQQTSAGVLERIGNFFEGTAARLDSMFQSRAFQYASAGAASYITRNPAPLMLTGSSARYLD